jgi:hypothetical protein
MCKTNHAATKLKHELNDQICEQYGKITKKFIGKA